MNKIIYLFKGDNNMKKEITIFDIANTFLTIESMTHKKLQKLCYYTQAWYLALNRQPLVNTDFEAWIHGPVCAELYHCYKTNGYKAIKSEKEEVPEIIAKDEYILNFIKNIHDVYGNLTGTELELLTHSEDPWKNARKGLREWEPSYRVISEEDMINYYSKDIHRIN